MNTIENTAQMILNAFNRDNELARLVCDYKSLGSIGEDVQSAIMDAHEGRLPNDTSYQLCNAVLEYIVENSIDDDSSVEFAESVTPDYNHVLLDWLCEHSDNLDLANDAINEGASNIVQAVSIGYQRYAEEVFHTMLTLVESLTEDNE